MSQTTPNLTNFNMHGMSGAVDERQNKFSAVTSGLCVFLSESVAGQEPSNFAVVDDIAHNGYQSKIAIGFKNLDDIESNVTITINTNGLIRFERSSEQTSSLQNSTHDFRIDDSKTDVTIISRIMAEMRCDPTGAFSDMPLDFQQGQESIKGHDNIHKDENIQRARTRLMNAAGVNIDDHGRVMEIIAEETAPTAKPVIATVAADAHPALQAAG